MASSAFSLRSVTDDDASFLLDLFSETHRSEYKGLSLPITQLEAILQMQFQAQKADYSLRHPEAIHEVIEIEGMAGGQWMWVEKNDHLLYIDISISKKFRNQGIASRLTKNLMKMSAQKKLPLRGYVALNNPKAIALWQRLGFDTVGSNQTHLAIEFIPDNSEGPTPLKS